MTLYLTLCAAIMVLFTACAPPEHKMCVQWEGDDYHAKTCVKWEVLPDA